MPFVLCSFSISIKKRIFQSLIKILDTIRDINYGEARALKQFNARKYLCRVHILAIMNTQNRFKNQSKCFNAQIGRYIYYLQYS